MADKLLSDDEFFGSENSQKLLSDYEFMGQDSFDVETTGDLFKRRGQELATGFGEGRASNIEGVGITAQKSLEQPHSRAAAGEMLPRWQAQINDINERLKDPNLNDETRAVLQRNLADLTQGAKNLGGIKSGDASYVRESYQEISDETRKWYKDTFGEAPKDDSFYSTLAQGMGSAGQFLVDSMVSGAVGGRVAALLTGGAEGSMQNSASFYKDAISHGASEEEALAAAGTGALVGLTEVVPVGRAFGWLPQAMRPAIQSRILRTVGEIAINAGEEAAQEAFTQFIQNAEAIGMGYDKDRSILEGVGEQALAGAIIGGGMTTLAAAAGKEGQPAPVKSKSEEVAPDEKLAVDGAPVGDVTPSGNEVAPDAQVALGKDAARSLAKDVLNAPAATDTTAAQPAPAGTPATEPTAPVQGTGEGTATEPETVPEAPQTLQEQAAALVDPKNKRRAMYVPDESAEGFDIPSGKRIGAAVVDGGVVYYDKTMYTKSEIKRLEKEGRLGTVLGLGNYNKAQVQETVDAGAEPVAVTERTPEGVEVKAAYGSTETAPEQIAALEATKTPGNEIALEPPQQVLDQRVAASAADLQPPAAPPAPLKPAEPAPPQVLNTPTVQEQVSQALEEKKATEEATTPHSPVPVTPTAPVERVTKSPTRAAAVEAAKEAAKKTKAETVKEVSRRRSEVSKTLEPTPTPKPEVTPEGNRVEITPEGKRRVILPTNEGVKERIDATNAQIEKNWTNKKKEDKTEQRAEAVKENREAVEEKIRAGELTSAVEETKEKLTAAKKAGSKRTSKKEETKLLKNAEIAGDLMEQHAPQEFSQLTSVEQLAATKDRLESIVAAADEAGFEWGNKGVTKFMPRAGTWLYDVRTNLRKLRAKKPTDKNLPALLEDINKFLSDEVAARRGDVRNMVERRLEEGAAVKKPKGSKDAAEAAVAAEPTAEVDSAGEEAKAVDTEGNVPVAKVSKGPMRMRHSEGAASEARTVSEEEAAAIKAKYETGPSKAVAAKETSLRRDKEEAAKKAAEKAAEPAKADMGQAAVAKAMRNFFDGKVLDAGDQAILAEVMSAANKDTKLKEAIEFAAKVNDPVVSKSLSTQIARKLGKGETKTVLPSARSGEVQLTPEQVKATNAAAVEVISFKEASSTVLSNTPSSIFTQFLKYGQRLYAAQMSSKMLAELNKLISDVKIHVVPDTDFDLINNTIEDIHLVEAWYDPLTDTIAIRESLWNDPSSAMRLIIHEGSHAAMSHVINSDERILAQVEFLRSITKSVAENQGWDAYGLEDAHEFLAEAWGNVAFQNRLTRIVIRKDDIELMSLNQRVRSTIKSAMDVLKSLLLDVLNLRSLFQSTPLNEGDKTVWELAMDLSGVIIEARTTQVEGGGTSVVPGAHLSRKKAPEPKLPDGVSKHSLEGRLMIRGVSHPDAKDIADLIREEHAGEVSKETMDAIAERITAEYKKVTSAGKAVEKHAQTAYDRNLSGIRRNMGKHEADIEKRLANAFVPGKNPGRPWLLSLATNLQIAQTAERYFGKKDNPVRVIANLIEARRVAKAQHLREATPVINDLIAAKKRYFRQGRRNEWAEFEALAQDATMANVHPDRSLEDNKHLSKNGMRDVWSREQHKELSARWARLNPELKDLYIRTRDQLTETQNKMTWKLIENILSAAKVDYDKAMVSRFHENAETDADKAAVGAELAKQISRATELKKIEGPYFNLVRRGEYVVTGTYKVDIPKNGRRVEKGAGVVVEFDTRNEADDYAKSQKLRSIVSSVWVNDKGQEWVTDDDGKEVKISSKDIDAKQVFRVTVQNKHVEFVDSRKQALITQGKLREAGLTVRDIDVKKYERAASNAEMLGDQYSAMSATIKKRMGESDLSKAQIAEIENALGEIAIRFLGATRIQSSRLPRRYVEGASLDLARNTFEYVDSASGYLAKLETAPALQDALKDLEERHDNLSKKETGAGEGSGMIKKELESRVYRALPEEDDGRLRGLSHRLTQVAFIDALASPAYSMINATQVGMFTVPVLAGDFSVIKANAAVAKAYMDIGTFKIVGSSIVDTGKALTGKMVTGDHFIDDISNRLTERREKDLLKELAAVGLIDADGGLEIARVLDTMKETKLAKFDKAVHWADNVVRAAPQAVEAINRSVTALAAYRLEYARSKNHQAAVRYAEDVVNDTQALMSNSNAAPVFSHPVFRVSLQFKKFGQMAYYLLGKQIMRALKPQTKGDRIKAAKTLAYLAATHAVMAGAVGLPGMEALRIATMLFSALGGGFDWDDFKQWMEESIADITGERLAEDLTYGFGRELGVDISTRLGQDSLMTFGEPRKYDQAGIKSFLWDTVVGPAGRTITDVMSGVGELVGDGKVTSLGKMIPVKMIADTMKAIEGGREGKLDTQDVILRVIGFTSARQAEIWNDIGKDIRENTREKDEKKSLEQDFINAVTHEEIVRARRAITRYNAKAGSGDRKISFKWMQKARRNNRQRYEEN